MRQLAEGSSGASRQARFTRRRLPPMARTRMGDIVMGNQRYKHRGTNAFYTKWLRALFENRVVYGVPKTWAVTILTLEQNPSSIQNEYKKFSQEDFALKSKL